MTETAYDYDVLAIRKRLGRDRWGPPQVGLTGPTGVHFTRSDGRRTIIVTSSEIDEGDDTVWLHASIAIQPDGVHVPDYHELVELHPAVWGDTGWACTSTACPWTLCRCGAVSDRRGGVIPPRARNLK